MTWSNILKSPFSGACFFDDRTRVTYCSHLVYSNEIQEINTDMPLDTDYPYPIRILAVF